jgi:methionyl-tRNA synthetase
VVGQAKSWLAEGLEDRSMTRDLPWGVPVPEDVAKAARIDASGKVMYVWFDAPIGYISATREWAAAQGDPERWQKYWTREDTKLVHFIGKDNIVFHTLVFPAMLKLHGGYVLPDNVPANEFLNLEGQKFSKSNNWGVYVNDALDAFPPDYLRYALLCVLPETKDSDFTWKEMQAHVNNELADTFGNFVNRSVAFVHRYLGGVVPAIEAPDALDQEMLAAVAAAPAQIGTLLEGYRFRDAGAALMGLARQANKYFNDSAPWASRTKDPARCAATLHVALQVAAALSILTEPFLPFTAARLRAMLGITTLRSSERAGGSGLGWQDAGKPLLSVGAPLGAAEVLVQKIEDAAIAAELAKLQGAAQPPADDGDLDRRVRVDQPAGRTWQRRLRAAGADAVVPVRRSDAGARLDAHGHDHELRIAHRGGGLHGRRGAADRLQPSQELPGA